MSNDYPKTGSITLRTHISDRPNTHAIVAGEIDSAIIRLNICGPKSVYAGFKPLVREGAFDVSELSIATYLQAKAYGKPLVLIPAVVLGRFQHDKIACRSELGDLRPKDIEGLRVGIRSYTVTTVVWARAILEHEYGVDLDRVTWVCHEDSHLAEFRDPPNVERIDLKGRTLKQVLIEGEVDAAILGAPVKDEPGIRPLIPDPAAAAAAWYKKHRVVSINHLFVVNQKLSKTRPDVVKELYRLLGEAKKASPVTEFGIDVLPFGLEANRKNLEFAIQYAYEQRLIPRRFTVDELFDDTTRQLDS